MSELLEDKIDRLIVGGARITEKGRLDFPDRLPFCPDNRCRNDCIFGKLWIYVKYNGRIGDEGCVAIGRCKPIRLKNRNFPNLYVRLDLYKEEVYKDEILPIILKFYDPNFMKELFDEVWPK